MTTVEAMRVFEQKVVHHCAPTLAGLKPSSLFNCVFLGAGSLSGSGACGGQVVERCRSKVASAGVSLSVLLQRQGGALVFVYRPDAIRRVLDHDASRAFLRQQGYDTSTPERCVEHLRLRLEESECSQECTRCEFPHEVGLLLGYPFEDVMGFIEHGGTGEVCRGHWKAYGDEDRARKTFDCYSRCRVVFDRKFAEGASIEELARIGNRHAA